MWRFFALGVCACNTVFGLDRTMAIDAAELPPDVLPPNVCPSIGTPPPFTAAKEMIPPSCTFYTPDGALERAVGECSLTIREGVNEDSLVTQSFTPVANEALNRPRLSPAADEIWLASTINNVPGGFVTFQRGTPGNWISRAPQTFASVPPPTATDGVSPPTTGGVGRRIILYADSSLYELENDSADHWRIVMRYTDAELGVGPIGAASITPDGLRMVFVAKAPTDSGPRIYYTDRVLREDAFRAASFLYLDDGNEQTPYLANDCSVLYFGNAGNVFAVRR